MQLKHASTFKYNKQTIKNRAVKTDAKKVGNLLDSGLIS